VIEVSSGACFVCGSSYRETSYGPSRFAECPNCGLARVLGYDGRSDYWDSKETHDPYWSEAKRQYFLSALSTLPQGRLVDFGGGVGEFAGVAVDAGWDAYSYDTSPEATAAAVERIGPRALAEAVASEFDVATLWCVIAHVPDPGGLLDSVHEALRGGGTLWLTTPNFAFQRQYARLLAVAGRPLVFGWGDDHVWHFTALSLRLMLEAHGFRNVEFHYRGVIEWCSTGHSGSKLLIAGKRAWNASVYAGYRLGMPLATSELQVTASRS
jgi:SAM-dependent methyltransferase